MDKTTIDAMRTVVDLIGRTVKGADSYGHGNVNTLDGVVLVSTLRAAVDGLRTLVDEAERAEGGAVVERAEGKAKVVKRLLATLNEMVQACDRSGDHEIRLSVEGEHRLLNAVFARVAIQIIEAMLAATPAAPVEPAEPTLEGYLAAVNRARHRGYGDWDFRIYTGNLIHSLNRDELIGVGRLLIERERADAAKGGAI